jgi:hypothetical protein
MPRYRGGAALSTLNSTIINYIEKVCCMHALRAALALSRDWFVIAMVALFGVMALAHVALAHDSWISRGGLRNPAGEWCCGIGDCKELNYSPRAVPAGFLLHNGETIPQAEVMPVSPEGWVICRRPDGSRRCVFSPPSGS